MKKRSQSKMMWAVRAYNDWRNSRLSDNNIFDINIFDANLDNLANLMKENLEYAMCRFIPEVRKLKDGDNYPGKTLYEMCVAIQKYVNERGDKNWKLVDGPDFKELRTVLDNVMKERASRNIGMVKRQASVILLDYENELWSHGLLGEDSPDKLRDTVLFLLGINLGLRAGDEHQNLRRHSPWKDSQLIFKHNDKGVRCLVYTEDMITKTHDGGLNSLRKEKKVVWVYPSSDITHCPVRLVDKDMGLCPPVTETNSKSNFYLRSLTRTTPAQWYSTRVLGINAIKKTIGELLKQVDSEKFFSYHSLRCSSTTRLFQAGVDRKLVKEFTGHSSDAIDKYQITSDCQCERISKIIAGKDQNKEKCIETKVETTNNEQVPQNSIEISLKNNSEMNSLGCSCTRSNVNLKDTQGLGQLLNDMLEGRKYGKAKIKLEIDLS